MPRSQPHGSHAGSFNDSERAVAVRCPSGPSDVVVPFSERRSRPTEDYPQWNSHQVENPFPVGALSIVRRKRKLLPGRRWCGGRPVADLAGSYAVHRFEVEEHQGPLNDSVRRPDQNHSAARKGRGVPSLTPPPPPESLGFTEDPNVHDRVLKTVQGKINAIREQTAADRQRLSHVEMEKQRLLALLLSSEGEGEGEEQREGVPIPAHKQVSPQQKVEEWLGQGRRI